MATHVSGVDNLGRYLHKAPGSDEVLQIPEMLGVRAGASFPFRFVSVIFCACLFSMVCILVSFFLFAFASI